MLHFIRKPVKVLTPASGSIAKRGFALFLTMATTLLFSSWGTKHNLMGGSAAHKLAISTHSLLLNGKVLNYKASTGYLPVSISKTAAANIFYTAYTTGNTNRPITFVFNGGPGSAAIWLHMGSIAPVRVAFKNEKGNAPERKYNYSDNPQSWLGFTDLVFIDPVSTGYSRAAEGVNARQFYSYKTDVASVGEFIQLYLQQEHRESSPKFLLGESYGAARAIGLAEYLQDKHAIKLTGLTLISPALNYKLLSFAKGNQHPYGYYLPTYAVTARYYHRLAPELQRLSPDALIAKVEAYVKVTYSRFLHADTLSQAPDSIIDSVHYYTGLPKAYLRRIKARITDKQFAAELLKTDSLNIGVFDSRFTGNTNTGADPSETNLYGLFTKAFAKYVGSSLQYQNTLTYNATIGVGRWDYGTGGSNPYFDVSATLKKVMSSNPNLKIQVIGGYYDLATPIAATSRMISDLKRNPQLRSNISVKYYQSGHMIYISRLANTKFQFDGERFYASAL